MPPQAETFTIGVEEEYQIIHPETRQLFAQAPKIGTGLVISGD